MTTSKTAVDNSQDDNAKKTVGHQIESSEFECIGGDILDTLPDCVPLPCARRVGTSTRYPQTGQGAHSIAIVEIQWSAFLRLNTNNNELGLFRQNEQEQLNRLC